ncbi:MAG: DUF2510 domain-containing protein [Acidimicrobiales bacterium]|nr:DUF2510 domain-containing protein [Acidimicrobiales bacterium]
MAWTPTPSPAPGWYPDPLARHEHRYWDGAGWTEHVADQGSTGSDPLGAPPPTPAPHPEATPHPDLAHPVSPPPYQPAGGAPPYQPGAPVQRTGPPVGLIVGLAIGAVVVIGLVAYLVLVRDDGGGGSSGTGTFTGQVEESTAPVLHRVQVPEGGTIVATVQPSAELDAEINLAVDEGLLRAYAEQLAGEAGMSVDELVDEAEFDSELGGYVLTTEDEGFEGETDVLDTTEAEIEGGLIAGTYVVSVTGYGDTTGTYELEIVLR